MSVLYVLVPVALVLVGAALGAFIWAARQGQFDDLATPSIRVVVDDAGEISSARADDSDTALRSGQGSDDDVVVEHLTHTDSPGVGHERDAP